MWKAYSVSQEIIGGGLKVYITLADFFTTHCGLGVCYGRARRPFARKLYFGSKLTHDVSLQTDAPDWLMQFVKTREWTGFATAVKSQSRV
jgi:hypothetical protein